ncbi:hypothetical protein L596_018467 [Steinernema carpocapsae]|nr:hypothetical protein L596_018467 [Steinernema carpocapsae]
MNSTYLTTTTGAYGGKDQKPTSFYAATGPSNTSTHLGPTSPNVSSYAAVSSTPVAKNGPLQPQLESRVAQLEAEIKTLRAICEDLIKKSGGPAIVNATPTDNVKTCIAPVSIAKPLATAPIPATPIPIPPANFKQSPSNNSVYLGTAVGPSSGASSYYNYNPNVALQPNNVSTYMTPSAHNGNKTGNSTYMK